ncbi:hypothetical protein LCGC14_1689340 [marine sediment metagenome]|uniref:Uncharacterized protein n=1 Tax=marine sediment metagenome TaxID=412755 RepID=A0A0F9KLE8_9ZZZZ
MANESKAPAKAAAPKAKPQDDLVEVDCLVNCRIHEGTYFDQEFKKGLVRVRRVDFVQILSRFPQFGKKIHEVSG